MASVVAGRTILSGSSSLRGHLKSSAAILRRAPCLVISSDLPHDDDTSPNPPPKVKTFRHNLSEYTKRAGFVMSMELGLRTVPSTVSSAYPTGGDIEACVEMARRVGAMTVIGVGAGAAIDCAKATAASLSFDSDDSVGLILGPATLGAIIAAMSSSPLILSTAEEALLPPHLACATDKILSPADFAPVPATVCLDGDAMAFIDKKENQSMTLATPIDAALSSLTVCVESSLLLSESIQRISGDEVENMKMLMEGARSNAVATLEAYRRTADSENGETEEAQRVAQLHSAAAVAHAGQLLRYGDQVDTNRKRSLSIAMCSSLLPRYFPHGHSLTFMAALLPGLCESNRITKSIRIGEQEIDDFETWSDQVTEGITVPKLVELAEGTPDVQTMMKKVDENSALVGCDEIGGYDLVEAVLHRSLNK